MGEESQDRNPLLDRVPAAARETYLIAEVTMVNSMLRLEAVADDVAGLGVGQAIALLYPDNRSLPKKTLHDLENKVAEYKVGWGNARHLCSANFAPTSGSPKEMYASVVVVAQGPRSR